MNEGNVELTEDQADMMDTLLMQDGSLLDWLAAEGLLDWAHVETKGADCE